MDEILCQHCSLPVQKYDDEEWIHPSVHRTYGYFYCTNALQERSLPAVHPSHRAEAMPYVIEELELT